MKNGIPEFLLGKSLYRDMPMSGKASRASFLDTSLNHFAAFVKTTYVQWESAHKKGLLQQLDSRVKLLFLLLFIVLISVKSTFLPEAAIGFVILVLAGLSRLNLVTFYSKIFLLGLVFGFLVVIPSSVNVVSGGDVIAPLIHLSKPYQFWIYRIPETVGITGQGLEGALLITLRVINSLSLSFLIIHTTPFSEIIRALKTFRVPDLFLVIITLSHKYIYIFAKTLEDIHLARKSKVVEARASDTTSWIAGRLAFLFRKTCSRCEEIFQAMLARGMTDDIVLYGCEKLSTRDIIAGAFMLITGVFLCLL